MKGCWVLNREKLAFSGGSMPALMNGARLIQSSGVCLCINVVTPDRVLVDLLVP